MTEFSEQEIRQTFDRYVATRNRIESGELPWSALAEFFTDDATFIDPAWGRVEGIAEIRKFLDESMLGLEDWSFPLEWVMVEGRRLVTMWQNRLAGRRADGSHYDAPGISVMHYAGGGKFDFEMDLLNMAHVGELIAESGWAPSGAFNMPPRNPKR
jgi:ketosteroid isomerase-like protein